jgi:hypothetical protein
LINALEGQNRVMTVENRDQAGFSLAVAQAAHPPFVLPMNWSFRPRTQRAWWGPIKVWNEKADPHPTLAQITQEQARPEAIVRFLKFN